MKRTYVVLQCKGDQTGEIILRDNVEIGTLVCGDGATVSWADVDVFDEI